MALALNQTCILFQLEHQAAGLLVGTTQCLHDFLGGEDDVDPALFIQPMILDRQTHAVQQDTVQDLGIGGQRLELRLSEKHLGDAIERELLGLTAVKVVKLHGCFSQKCALE